MLSKTLLFQSGILLLCAGMLLTGCGGNNAGKTEGTAGEPGASAGAKEGNAAPLGALSERFTGDLDEMVKYRRIRALVIYSKTFYFYDRGRPRGLSCEGLLEFERFLNKKLKTGKLAVHILFIPVSRDQLIPALIDGRGDIAAANLTITPEREELVDFSDPFFDNAKEIVITGPSGPPLSGLDDLAGKEVHVRASSSYYEHLQRLNASFRKEGKQPVKVIAADEHLEDEDLLEMVNAGLIPATVTDNHKAQFWNQIFDNITPHPEVTIASGGRIAWAFRKNSPKLAAMVNAFVKGHKIGTAFGNTVLRRYLRKNKWIKNAASKQELAKFYATIDLFKKYAKEYDFDWLMLAAQAYQESGLDNNVKSPVGAVGIMQVMPKTASSSPINIPNIWPVDNNIHAGVKLLRHYRDQYFNDPAMNDLNQTLMTFAGYNAGPNRINRLRKKAAAQGLNPNKWFNNVELVVAKSVGREPVRYVSNVFKYYIAYKMIEERGKSIYVDAGSRGTGK